MIGDACVFLKFRRVVVLFSDVQYCSRGREEEGRQF